MKAPDTSQLAALELRLCDLAHPDWMASGAVPLQNGAEEHDEPRSLALTAALSRWLIDDQRLAMLSPSFFTHSWTYAVLGGHAATQSLHEQTVAYLMGNWVRRAVAGAQARLLHTHFGAAAYDEALHRTAPLSAWRAPRQVSQTPALFVKAEAGRLLAALWEREAPDLARWARVMVPPAPATYELDIDLNFDNRTTSQWPSRALLDELNSRLQADFTIDLDEAQEAADV